MWPSSKPRRFLSQSSDTSVDVLERALSSPPQPNHDAAPPPASDTSIKARRVLALADAGWLTAHLGRTKATQIVALSLPPSGSTPAPAK